MRKEHCIALTLGSLPHREYSGNLSAHKVGACRLEVSRGDGNVITQPVIFDYKVNPNSERAGGDDGGCAVPEGGDRVELKNTLLQKLEVLCDKMRETDDVEEGGDGDAGAAKIPPPADAAAAAQHVKRP